jgi:hypothetical protein
MLPLCSRKHHHALKRRLTPADLDWPASLQPNCCAVFSSNGKASSRAVAQVLYAA